MKIGFIGLGKMGHRIVTKLLEGDHEVTVWNRSPQPVADLLASLSENERKLYKSVETLGELAHSLSGTRVIWSMLPAGDATELVLQELLTFCTTGDIIIDGGNAYWKDTERRAKEFAAKGIRFLGIGVSGGILAGGIGFPLMVGGEKTAYDEIVPLLDTLAKPNGGHDYFGPGGAGHFMKMVHNGIEYGMMQAIGEGFGILEKSGFGYNLEKVAKLFQKNTIVSGFLMDRTASALEKDPTLTHIDGVIDESGEAVWTIEQAKEEHVPVPVIEESLEFRKKSKIDPGVSSSIAAKLVAALRHEFGGHDVKEK